MERSGVKTIILASQSPRRARLLEQVRVRFEMLAAPSDDVEAEISARGLTPEQLAERLAEAKLDAAIALAPGNAVVLCADTIVVAPGGSILGKPADAGHAERMLRALSGAEHEVITAVALQDTDTGRRRVFHERTAVVFRTLDDGEIARYARSGHPLDKAGAYGIQGLAGAFVSEVRGCYSNVVGLPLARLAAALKQDFDFDITQNW